MRYLRIPFPWLDIPTVPRFSYWPIDRTLSRDILISILIIKLRIVRNSPVETGLAN